MHLNRSAILGLAGACAGRLLWPVIRHSLRRTINVVYYHFIGIPDPHYEAFYRGCSTERFAQDLNILSRVFDFVPLAEVLAGPSTKSRRPLLAVTFDDGFDLRKNGIMELLDQFGIKATTFVVTAVVGNRKLMWRYMLSAIQSEVPSSVWRPQYIDLAATHGISPLLENQTLLEATYHQWDMERKDEWAAELWNRCAMPPLEQYLAETRPYFDWEGLHEWLGAGHAVGFHTHTHPFCSRLGPADLEKELIQPVLRLKERLALNEVCLSYPFGDRLQPALEHKLFESGLFKAFFGTGGFAPRDAPNDKLGRLGLDGYPVRNQLRSERFHAFRCDVKKRWVEKYGFSRLPRRRRPQPQTIQ